LGRGPNLGGAGRQTLGHPPEYLGGAANDVQAAEAGKRGESGERERYGAGAPDDTLGLSNRSFEASLLCPDQEFGGRIHTVGGGYAAEGRLRDGGSEVLLRTKIGNFADDGLPVIYRARQRLCGCSFFGAAFRVSPLRGDTLNGMRKLDELPDTASYQIRLARA
jgi:hypothetical protein